MLKLKNLKIEDNVIFIDYDPEETGELGHISMDKRTGEVISFVLSSIENEVIPLYFSHAKDAMIKMVLNGEIEERLVMWG